MAQCHLGGIECSLSALSRPEHQAKNRVQFPRRARLQCDGCAPARRLAATLHECGGHVLASECTRFRAMMAHGKIHRADWRAARNDIPKIRAVVLHKHIFEVSTVAACRQILDLTGFTANSVDFHRQISDSPIRRIRGVCHAVRHQPVLMAEQFIILADISSVCGMPRQRQQRDEQESAEAQRLVDAGHVITF